MRRHQASPIRYGSTGVLVVAVAAGVWLLVGGSGSTPQSSSAVSSSPSPTRHLAQPAGLTPSVSAQMVCARKTQRELASVLRITATVPTAPTWVDHLYSCRYVYPNGVAVLSVKELSSRAETSAYFASLRRQLGETERFNRVAQGAFVTRNGSLVLRKDYKVLLVDASGLPDQFASGFHSRSSVALAVATTVLGCWTGA